MISQILATTFGVLAVIGVIYHAAAALALRKHRDRDKPADSTDLPPASVLKPVCGDEPRLRETLQSFCEQDYPDYEVLLGAATVDDAGLAVARELEGNDRCRSVQTFAPPTLRGMNRKVCSLEMLAANAKHETIVLSDSHIIVQPNYLSHIMRELQSPNTGIVTCAYIARPTKSFWARIGALGVNFSFLPSVMFSHVNGMVKSAYGGTVALSKSTLEQVGGFEAIADALADDFEIARAVQADGKKLVLSRYLVETIFSSLSFRQLLDRELRWARTIRTVQPIGYAFSIITQPTLFALLCAIAGLGGGLWLGIAGACLAARWGIALFTSRLLGVKPPRPDLLLLRDLLSIGIFALSYAGRTVVWRGRRMRLLKTGLLEAAGT